MRGYWITIAQQNLLTDRRRIREYNIRCKYCVGHLVSRGLCSTIEVWRLPVGHTHEDIDGRFGVLSQHIRELSIETPQKFFVETQKAFYNDCDLTYVAAIYDYKAFYDKLRDPLISVKKEEYTNLGFRIEKLTTTEMEKIRIEQERSGALAPALFDVKVNYKKCAQDVTVDLRPMNPLYDGSAESDAEIFYPVAICSRWIPMEADREEDRYFISKLQ